MTGPTTTATIDSARPATIEEKALAAGMKNVKSAPSTRAYRAAVVKVLQDHLPKKVKPDAAIAVLADMIGSLIPTLPDTVTEADVLNLVNVNVKRGAAKTRATLQSVTNLR